MHAREGQRCTRTSFNNCTRFVKHLALGIKPAVHFFAPVVENNQKVKKRFKFFQMADIAVTIFVLRADETPNLTVLQFWNRSSVRGIIECSNERFLF